MNAALKTAAAALTLSLLSSASWAAEMPKPCGPDPRERCVSYKPGQIVTLVLAPGRTMIIELPEGETVYYIGASDNSVIKGDDAADRVAVNNNTTEDPNLETSVPGPDNSPSQFVSLKAKKELEPQPFLVIGQWNHPVPARRSCGATSSSFTPRRGSQPTRGTFRLWYSVGDVFLVGCRRKHFLRGLLRSGGAP